MAQHPGTKHSRAEVWCTRAYLGSRALHLLSLGGITMLAGCTSMGNCWPAK